MQATQPLRTFHPVRAGVAGLLAAALFAAAVIAASVLPSIGRSGAGTDAGAAPAPVLKLDPDSRDGGTGLHPNIPR